MPNPATATATATAMADAHATLFRQARLWEPVAMTAPGAPLQAPLPSNSASSHV